MPTNFKKLTGDLAQTSVGGATQPITGCTTAVGSPVVNTTGSLAGIAAGQVAAGTGIPVGTTILSVGTGTFTLSANATAAGTGLTVTATGEVQVVGLMEWSISIKLKTPEATTTDDAAWESSLPSSKSWTAKANYCYYEGDISQRSAILSTINQPGVVTRWNFFPDAVLSDDAFWGNAFVDSIDLTAGSGKIVGVNITLKGTGPLVFAPQIAPLVTTTTNTGLQAEV